MSPHSINPIIFRAYDIRGIYPADLNEDAARQIGCAFLDFLLKKYGVKSDDLRIVLGRDIRLGSRAVAEAFIAACVARGAGVTDIGLVSTDMMYFAVGHFNYDGGVMVTASHNPKEYTGLKFVGRGVEGIDGETGVYEMRDAILSGLQKISTPQGNGDKARKENILHFFTDHVLSFISGAALRPLTVVVDAGNGMASLIWRALETKLPIKLIPLFFDLDGEFPARGPDPGKRERMNKLCSIVKARSADIGFAFDGDGDRVYVVDERGEFIDGSILLAAFAENIARSKKNAVILYNVTAGRIIRDVLNMYPEVHHQMTPVGHSRIKRAAKEHGADFAGEPQSAHYFFKENFYADSASIFALKLLLLISGSDQPISKLLAPYKKYHWSGEINFTFKMQDTKFHVIDEIQNQYRGNGVLTDIDGARYDFGNWWFLVRASNTEAMLRLNVEADSLELMEKKREELISLIKQYDPIS